MRWISANALKVLKKINRNKLTYSVVQVTTRRTTTSFSRPADNPQRKKAPLPQREERNLLQTRGAVFPIRVYVWVTYPRVEAATKSLFGAVFEADLRRQKLAFHSKKGLIFSPFYGGEILETRSEEMPSRVGDFFALRTCPVTLLLRGIFSRQSYKEFGRRG